MTLRNFPPADQCSPENLDAIADLVVSDPSASYDLAGSREHIEALCRRYQALAQDLSAAAVNCTTIALERDRLREQCDGLAHARKNQAERAEFFAGKMEELRAERDAALATSAALERALAAATNDRDKWEAMCTSACRQRDVLLVERDAARTEIRALQDTLAAERNERQAEVLAAEGERARADDAESLVEVHEAIARAALAVVTRTAPVDLAELVHAVDGRLSRALVRERKISAALSEQWEAALLQLEQRQQTEAANERLRSAFADACLGLSGQTIEQVNIQLDAEFAAHPEPGPLHHARDQRDRDEPIIRTTLDAALKPCEHRTDVPCAGCEMSRRRKLFNQGDTTP